jgi:hypothetical protein
MLVHHRLADVQEKVEAHEAVAYLVKVSNVTSLGNLETLRRMKALLFEL